MSNAIKELLPDWRDLPELILARTRRSTAPVNLKPEASNQDFLKSDAAYRGFLQWLGEQRPLEQIGNTGSSQCNI